MMHFNDKGIGNRGNYAAGKMKFALWDGSYHGGGKRMNNNSMN